VTYWRGIAFPSKADEGAYQALMLATHKQVEEPTACSCAVLVAAWLVVDSDLGLRGCVLCSRRAEIAIDELAKMYMAACELPLQQLRQWTFSCEKSVAACTTVY
jgi:hypothetical protein